MWSAIWRFIERGWRLIEGWHTAAWLLGLAGFAGIPVWLTWKTFQHPAFLFVVGVLAWAALFLCVLGYYGYRAQQTPSQAAVARNEEEEEEEEDIEPARSADELISMREAATRLYESSASWAGSLLRIAAEKLGGRDIGAASPNERLDYLATFISRKIPVLGRKPPDRLAKGIDEADIRRATFCDGAMTLRDNMHDQQIYWVDLSVRARDFDALAAALSPDVPDEEAAFNRGYLKVAARSSRESALAYLSVLRDAGTVIRNHGGLVRDSTLADWERDVVAWMNDTVDAIRLVSEADAIWLRTLRNVPPPTIPIESQCIHSANRDAHLKAYREHDCRLERLDGLLRKYGVGV